MKIVIIQPYLTNYRIPVFCEIAESTELTVISSNNSDFGVNENKFNFNNVYVKEFCFFKKRIIYQTGVIHKVFRIRPDLIMLSANPRYISSMLLILILRFFSVKVLLHGQGLYKKDKVGFLNKITYTYFNFFCDKYICYSKTSMESLAKLAIMKKSIVCENSLINYCGVERKYSGENGVLFVGRLRNESNINFLIQLAQYNPKLQIHIVGSSGLINEFKEISNKLKNIIFYGEIYEFEKISEISKNCFIGVYPGDAGLSVVHYMSLSLPVLVHDDLKKHMGPEPSYVKNNFNGLLFKRGDFISFANGINKFFEMDVTEKNLFMENSYNTYKDLVNPSLANRFLDCFYEVSNGKN